VEGIDEREIVFDGGDPVPERFVQAWVAEFRKRGLSAVLT